MESVETREQNSMGISHLLEKFCHIHYLLDTIFYGVVLFVLNFFFFHSYGQWIFSIAKV